MMDVCTSVITGGYAPPVFEAPEHVFDFVALFILGFAEVCRCLSAFAWRNAGRNVLGLEGISILVGIVPLVSDQGRGLGQSRIDDFGPNIV